MLKVHLTKHSGLISIVYLGVWFLTSTVFFAVFFPVFFLSLSLFLVQREPTGKGTRGFVRSLRSPSRQGVRQELEVPKGLIPFVQDFVTFKVSVLVLASICADFFCGFQDRLGLLFEGDRSPTRLNPGFRAWTSAAVEVLDLEGTANGLCSEPGFGTTSRGNGGVAEEPLTHSLLVLGPDGMCRRGLTWLLGSWNRQGTQHVEASVTSAARPSSERRSGTSTRTRGVPSRHKQRSHNAEPSSPITWD